MARENKQKRDERRFGKPRCMTDRLLNSGITLPEWTPKHMEDDFFVYREDFLSMIPHCKTFDITNISNFKETCLNGSVEELLRGSKKSIPFYDNMFVYSYPSIAKNSSYDWSGIFATVLTFPKSKAIELARFHARTLWALDKCKFVSFISWGIETKCGNFCGPFATQGAFISGDGELICFSDPSMNIGKCFDDETQQGVSSTTHRMTEDIFLSIFMVNDKKAAISENKTEDKEVDRNRKKNGMKPFVRYNTIILGDILKKTYIDSISLDGEKRPLHSCRGSFATYRDTFFGRKLSEPKTVWRPAHLRGSAEHGISISDYIIKAPTEGDE